MTTDCAEFETFLHRHFARTSIENGLDAQVQTLRMDSLQLLDFILAIEKAFGVDLDVDAITDTMTLRELHAKVVSLQRGVRAA
jgi:acyl carrier protein